MKMYKTLREKLLGFKLKNTLRTAMNLVVGSTTNIKQVQFYFWPDLHQYFYDKVTMEADVNWSYM